MGKVECSIASSHHDTHQNLAKSTDSVRGQIMTIMKKQTKGDKEIHLFMLHAIASYLRLYETRRAYELVPTCTVYCLK